MARRSPMSAQRRAWCRTTDQHGRRRIADGNMWIGTDASGALRIAAFGLVSYFEADGLRNDFVPFLFEDDPDDVIAVSASRFSINEFDGRRFASTRFNVPPRRAGYRFFRASRPPGRLVARDAGGPVSIPGHVRRIADVARVTPDAHYAGIRALPSDESVPAFRGRTRRHLADRPVIGSGQARSLASCVRRLPDIRRIGGLGGIPSRLDGRASRDRRGPAGQLFFGFREAGLFAYRDGRFESILDGGEPFGVISLHLDRLGRLWIIGLDGTVRRLDNLSTRRLTTDTKVARQPDGRERPVHGRGRQRPFLLWHDERSHRSRSGERRHAAVHDGRRAGAERSLERPGVPAWRPLVRDNRRGIASRSRRDRVPGRRRRGR